MLPAAGHDALLAGPHRDDPPAASRIGHRRREQRAFPPIPLIRPPIRPPIRPCATRRATPAHRRMPPPLTSTTHIHHHAHHAHEKTAPHHPAPAACSKAREET